MSMQLARAGKEAIESKTKAHRDAISSRGYGTHYGDHSSYTPPAGASVTKSSCVVWAMECAEYAFDKVGRGAVWDQVAKVTRRNQLKGTFLIRELIARGWTGIYWNPDVTDKSDGEHSYSAHIARTKKTYYNLPVSDMVLDYRRRPVNMAGLNKLDKVPFWVGCARGGSHVFCGTGGNVSEFHWTAAATNPKAMELVALKDYAWMSGIIAVPPTVWQST
ncbi:MAG: hypothetical protein KUG77_10375 [Nannocystaceae bacterium]|nr:hypothetical protein [Nannocystaceae bacterium]